MSNGFYDFIAKRIKNYFQNIASAGFLSKGETFCLKLDNEEMIQKVHESLEKLLEEEKNIGEYSYKDSNIYQTFTIKVENQALNKVLNDEVIIASQINGMTSDFLCATLRNAANEAKKTLLMISTDFIDSAKSSSRDLSTNGMPFHPKKLKEDIQDKIEKKEGLNNITKKILLFVLKQQINDYDSISEYKDLITILQNGEIKKEDFASLSLFPIDITREYQNYNDNQIEQVILENNNLFKKIDDSFKSNNHEEVLSEHFGDSELIKKIEEAQQKDHESWSKNFSYSELKKAYEQYKKESKKTLEIEDSDIIIYGNASENKLLLDEDFMIRNDGETNAKKKKKNIFIFNKNSYLKIHIQINCNIEINDSDISRDNSIALEKQENSRTFIFTRKGITFHQIKIKKYTLTICIMDLPKSYLFDTQKYYAVINLKPKKAKGIKIIDHATNLTKLIFNSNATDTLSEKLEDNKTYNCSYDKKLILCSTEEELFNFEKNIKFKIDFSGLIIPFLLEIDEEKSNPITGHVILRDKIADQKSFQFDSKNEVISKDSITYSVKEKDLLQELKIEQKIIDEEYFHGVYNNNSENLEKRDLQLTDELKNAYLDLLKAFRENKTIPTLAYLGNNFNPIALKYVNAFKACFDNLQDSKTLTEEQKDALLLGTLLLTNDSGKIEEIWYTPFHPLNIKYQLELLKENGFKEAEKCILNRLNSINLLPYIKKSQDIYKVSEKLYSQEWKYYAPVENKKYRGSRKYVSDLVKEKISEFISHFKYMFDDINNRIVRINLINMGDCSQVFFGLVQYFNTMTKDKNADINKLFKFEIHIYYGNHKHDNVFNNIKDYERLKNYLETLKSDLDSNISLNSLSIIIAKNIKCYFYEDSEQNYKYAHLSFYEIESSTTSGQATMSDIETGVSLSGLVSGIPSSKYGQNYRTGFSSKYAEENELMKFAKLYNSLMQVSDSGNPYYSNASISTQIDEKVNQKIEHIYEKSNWVVFVDPKVDLDFFREKENSLLIIHYSDQYTSSSGYDAITVTKKSKQYYQVIKEFIQDKNSSDDVVTKIINLFNAINGNWLLRVISLKNEEESGNYFAREKISIIASIKFILAYLKCKYKDMIWIPISTEEMLRVSRGLKLSQDTHMLSKKNLKFKTSRASDDLLFIGINTIENQIKIYLYPVEVKTGNNEKEKISEALEQVSSTANAFKELFNPLENKEHIQSKVQRNFLMQILVTSCKKMKVYHVDDSQNWDLVLDKYREALLNEKYSFLEDIQKDLGKGLVFSFKRNSKASDFFASDDELSQSKEFKIIEMSENQQIDLILKDIDTIYNDIQENKLQWNENELSIPTKKTQEEHVIVKEQESSNIEDNAEIEDHPILDCQSSSHELIADVSNEKKKGMEIVFGINERNGESVIWSPNDTKQVFHTNTGIIGTMGTGKTQFTKSLITQLYLERINNIYNEELCILIFDYKGDYNENKQDFVNATKANILKPYHLPFNPLALTKGITFKQLLPMHTANAFKETLAKAFRLGPKQQETLSQCIMKAYKDNGIDKNKAETWDYTAPTFEQVYQCYKQDNDIPKNDSLSAALNKLHNFEYLESNPNETKSLFELLKGVVVIDLSGYDADIQSFIIAITLDLFYSQMQNAGSSKIENNNRQITKIILVDEADNFMSEGFPSLKKILKEGREFGVGTILSSQSLKHFGNGEDDYSNYILTWIVHNVSDLKNSDVEFIFKTDSKDTQQYYNAIKSLEKHHSIIKIGNEHPVYLKDKAFYELYNEQFNDDKANN